MEAGADQVRRSRIIFYIGRAPVGYVFLMSPSPLTQINKKEQAATGRSHGAAIAIEKRIDFVSYRYSSGARTILLRCQTHCIYLFYIFFLGFF
jgi:hypothetical protein